VQVLEAQEPVSAKWYIWGNRWAQGPGFCALGSAGALAESKVLEGSRGQDFVSCAVLGRSRCFEYYRFICLRFGGRCSWWALTSPSSLCWTRALVKIDRFLLRTIPPCAWNTSFKLTLLHSYTIIPSPFMCFMFGRQTHTFAYASSFSCTLPLTICMDLGFANLTIHVLSAKTSLIFSFFTVSILCSTRSSSHTLWLMA